MKLRELPIGIQTFELIRKKDSTFVYVDKTREIYELAKGGEKRYFLSRPRRFGKSLLCSTFKSLFEGRKDLFKGLWIAQTDWRWEKHPVVHLSFSQTENRTPETLTQSLMLQLKMFAEEYKIILPEELKEPKDLFVYLCKKLSEQNKVVLIIDEYDKPILDHISNTKNADNMRKRLKSFYEAIKDLDIYLHFIFITGVTKFTKTSIFSGINNLEDITLSEQAQTICGFTYEEIITTCDEFIERAAKGCTLSKQEYLNRLKTWYNGYCFNDKNQEIRVYNPFSLLLAFKHKDFKNYWFSTGTPTFLIELIKKNNYPIMDYQRVEIRESELESMEINKIKLSVLMLQAGYLTVVDYIKEYSRYVLSYPNYEVFRALADHLSDELTTMQGVRFDDYVIWFRQALLEGDIEHFCKTLKQFFSEIPYTIQVPGVERYYQTIFFIICRLLTRQVWVEQATNTGRIDAVLEFEQRIVIVELKVNQSGRAALAQIKEKKYANSYMSSGKEIVLVGINFDSHMRNISDDWVVDVITSKN
ncbi:AAA family ATPase [Candidatus Dependentiae bacterium]|nr:AAA family ATPase [Candidatus Dependentiae bacterium]